MNYENDLSLRETTWEHVVSALAIKELPTPTHNNLTELLNQSGLRYG
jgi:hypothetical protein